jgi:uncharacterized protein YjiK
MSTFYVRKDILSGRLAKFVLIAFSVFMLIAVCTTCPRNTRGKLHTIMQPTTLNGINKNLSGLTWNAETETLFAATNDPEFVYELSTGGEVLRSIKLQDFKDTEGITHIQSNLFAIVEERRGVLSIFHIPDNVTEVGHDIHARLDLGKAPVKNKGFESLSYDPATRTIFTIREGKPFIRRDIVLDEMFMPIEVHSRPLPALKVKDVASIVFSSDGHFWYLSEASNQIVELNSDGAVLRTFKLDIDRKKFQPEGITLDMDGVIYIIGEPNILAAYRISD